MQTAFHQKPSNLAHETFHRVRIDLPGRLMRASYEEFDCTVTEMSPGDVRFETEAKPVTGERIVAYLDHLGRVEGHVSEVAHDGFVLELNATDRKRDKLAAQLTWIANKHELSLPEDRRHERLSPRKAQCDIRLNDGREYPCRIIDLSLSGAAISLDVRPAVGAQVTLGTMRGRVVRHFEEGVAIEFAAIQPQDALKRFL
ncbi:PilZ domain-containing protein [Pararhizobium mangrovi]|uniref:PilZ domain-containing protein n=1 Tax=Pararhizobium mangrovi TaxID=2590452 RepID=A0A506UCP9_9HYPH|nr:PilZ domain-containing protein [Pararhizobium mangrovi]TPW31378.1 PilZ domain-containing protein [Pararhizobium mangrovi]